MSIVQDNASLTVVAEVAAKSFAAPWRAGSPMPYANAAIAQTAHLGNF